MYVSASGLTRKVHLACYAIGIVALFGEKEQLGRTAGLSVFCLVARLRMCATTLPLHIYVHVVMFIERCGFPTCYL